MKLQRQFAHPETDKLYKLLKIARSELISPNAFKVLLDGKEHTYRFKISMGTEDFRFNKRVFMAIIAVLRTLLSFLAP